MRNVLYFITVTLQRGEGKRGGKEEKLQQLTINYTTITDENQSTCLRNIMKGAMFLKL